MKRRTIERLVIAFLFVAICVVFAERANRPPAAVPASASPTVFSAERAMKHVLAIAQRPHPVGSAEHDRVRDYLIAQLSTWASSRRFSMPLALAHAMPAPEECRTFSRECPTDRAADQRSFLWLITTASKPDRVPEMMAPVSPPFSRPFVPCGLEARFRTT